MDATIEKMKQDLLDWQSIQFNSHKPLYLRIHAAGEITKLEELMRLYNGEKETTAWDKINIAYKVRKTKIKEYLVKIYCKLAQLPY